MQNNTPMIIFFSFFALGTGSLGAYGGYQLGYDRATLEGKAALATKDAEIAAAKAAAPAKSADGGKKEKVPFAPSTLSAMDLSSVPDLSDLKGAEQEKALYIFNNIQGACQPCNETGRSLGQCYLDMSKLVDRNICANIPKLAKRVVTLAEQGASPDDIRAVTDLGSWQPLDPGAAPMHGSKDAPITLVEISDFQCPYCKKAQDTMHALDEKYGTKIRKYFINLPLQMHKMAAPAAKAALAAHLQGKFWEFHDALFSAPKLDDEEIAKMASTLGLDVPRWDKDRQSLPIDEQVQKDAQRMGKLGITSTPMFFVNGYKVKGAQPLDAFARIIDAELADASN